MDIKRINFRNIAQIEVHQPDTSQHKPMQSNVDDHSTAVSENLSLEQKVIAAIRTVYDPEIHVNVYDLGLIYNININDKSEVNIDMTLTAPACPVAEILPNQVVKCVKTIDGIDDVKVSIVWDPPWSQACISDAARLELGLL